MNTVDINNPATLEECTKNVPYFSFENLETKAKCVKVYDGDTITVVFDTFGTFRKHHIRVDKIDTPELRTKDAREKELAIKARDFLREKILDKIIMLKCGKSDKYGRILALIYIDGVEINQLMIDKKYAYAYFGGTKSDVFKTKAEST
jgi:micrococcal nuclease